MKFLLDNNAQINVRVKNCHSLRSPLFEAARYNQKEIYEILKTAGAV